MNLNNNKENNNMEQIYKKKKVTLFRGNAIDVLNGMDEEIVDCIVTSPPYYSLRDYKTDGQIGAEKTEEEYLDSLVAVFRAARRVLKDSGVFFLNIGDRYWKKQLRCMPWKLALKLAEDGWILRQDIIWHKPNPMPESIKSRCTKSHEYIFMFTKTRKHYFGYWDMREPAKYSKEMLEKRKKMPAFEGKYSYADDKRYRTRGAGAYKPDGWRAKRSVWTMGTTCAKSDHPAPFPDALAKNCILAGCPENMIVLDPFAGSGTVGRVANSLDREAYLIELSDEYADSIDEMIKKIPKKTLSLPWGEDISCPAENNKDS